ncbi:MAG: hypothetical protein U1E23_17040 [Reyranellaceae bacterium]
MDALSRTPGSLFARIRAGREPHLERDVEPAARTLRRTVEIGQRLGIAGRPRESGYGTAPAPPS